MNTNRFSKGLRAESGNAVVLVLAALLVVGVGAYAYFSGNLKNLTGDKASPVQAVADAQPASGEAEDAVASAAADTPAPQSEQADNAPEAAPVEIKPGNPVVAKIGDKEIKRAEVAAYMQSLPANIRQLPPEQVFPLALQQVVNMRIIADKAKGAKLDDDPAVKAQLAEAKQNIERTVFMQKEVEKRVTEDRLKKAYEEYKEKFPKVEEVEARHILVKDEATAKDLIKKLKDGADFAALAKEYSIDGTKNSGGQLAYFTDKEVVPEFAKAVFAQKVGSLSDKPVKSQFGYHVVEVQDKRQRQPASYEQVKTFLAAELQNEVLGELMDSWRKKADVKLFDINGDAIEPAAGE